MEVTNITKIEEGYIQANCILSHQEYSKIINSYNPKVGFNYKNLSEELNFTINLKKMIN